jgi:anti-sigma-K factor RskA
MTCAERRDELLLHVAGMLDESERRELQAHLESGCPACAGALAEAEAVLYQVPLALEPVVPSADVRRRLLERVEPPRGETVSFGAPARRSSFVASWLRPAIAAGLTAAAMFFLVALPMRGRLETRIARQELRIADLERAGQTQKAVVNQQRVELEQLRAQVSIARRVMSRPETLVAGLRGTEVEPRAGARIFWDRDANRWYLVVSGMQPPAAGRTHQLWFITADQQAVSAGTFTVDQNGDGSYDVEVATGIGTIVKAAITDEPAGGSTQPTGQIRVAGSVRETT